MDLYKLLLITHVILGSIGLLVGTIVLFIKKGTAIHKKLGTVFTYAMLLSGFTALVLSIINPSTFLFAIGIFTIYLIGTGTRHIALKLKGDTSASPNWIDWTLTLLMLGFGLVLVSYGIYKIANSNYFGIALLVFGSVGLSGVRQDFKYYKGLEKDRMYWLKTHIARMTGGYIAATTAFLVNNTQHLPNIPGYIYWLLPTVILTPLIKKWQKQYLGKNT